MSEMNILNNMNTQHEYFSSRFAVALVKSTEARCLVENEDAVGAAQNTYGTSTISLPTTARFIS